jgi:hypothetical protein
MRRALLVPLALVLALAAPACGSDDGDDGSADTTTPTTAPETIPEEPQPDRTAERTRFVLAPVQSSGGCPPDVTAPPTTADTAGADADAETPSTPEADDSEEADATVPTAAASPYPTADGVFCYWIGEPEADGNDLFDATISQTNEEEWQVFTRVKPESLETVDGLFTACLTGEASCPPGPSGRGAVAIIWDGVVLHAPAIEAEGIAEGSFSLGGGLTERQARDLVTLINR